MGHECGLSSEEERREERRVFIFVYWVIFTSGHSLRGGGWLDIHVNCS